MLTRGKRHGMSPIPQSWMLWLLGGKRWREKVRAEFDRLYGK